MSNSQLAQRYAKALFELAQEKNELEQVAEDLDLVKDVLKQEDLRRFLYREQSSKEAQRDLLTKILSDQVSRLTMKALSVLIDNGRIEYLDQVLAAFERLVDEATGVVEAEVRTARDLSDSLLEELQSRLQSWTGSEVRLQQVVDPELLGGLEVNMGALRLDATIDRRLRELRRSMSGSGTA